MGLNIYTPMADTLPCPNCGSQARRWLENRIDNQNIFMLGCSWCPLTLMDCAKSLAELVEIWNNLPRRAKEVEHGTK
jgi:hypothetical protein